MIQKEKKQRFSKEAQFRFKAAKASFNSLEEVLKLIIDWEKTLYVFYDMLLEKLTNERSRETVGILKKQQAETLKMLGGIKLADYRKTEFIKYIPDFHSESIIPRLDLSDKSTSEEIFDQVLAFEEKLEEYYVHLKDILRYEMSKDLMAMLTQFKMGQIKKLKAYMDNYGLIV